MSTRIELFRITEFQTGSCSGTRATVAGELVTESGALRGVWESLPMTPNCAIESAIASWNGSAQPGTWIEVAIRVEQQGKWSRWYSFGRWTAGPERSSLGDQEDEGAKMETDTLALKVPADRFQLRVTLEGRSALGRLYLLVTGEGREPATGEPHRLAWGTDLQVPERSQMIYPEGGRVWCSPVCLTMILAYWGRDMPVSDVVPLVYDRAYGGHGNWPFNTAGAGVFRLDACVMRLYGLPQLERLVHAGIPAVASVAYRREWLQGAPIDQTAGHLLVVRGFTAEGDVIVNDPAAADDTGVRLVYQRQQFERAWMAHSKGIIYLIRPPEHPLPDAWQEP